MNKNAKFLISWSIFLIIFGTVYCSVFKANTGHYPFGGLSFDHLGKLMMGILGYVIILFVTGFLPAVLIVGVIEMLARTIPALNQCKVVEKYLNGQIKSEYFTNYFSFYNTILGEYHFYFENGVLKQKGETTSSGFRVKIITDKEYNEFGTLISEKNTNHDFYNEKKWNEKAVLIEEKSYKGGKLDGVQKTFYDNGNIEREWICKEGRRMGPEKTYWENGSIKSEYIWKKITKKFLGIRYKSEETSKDGHYTEFHKNGRLREEGILESNWYVGQRTFYNDDGTLSAILEHVPKLHYLKTEYYPSGKRKCKGLFKRIGNEWKQRGKWEYFDEEGNLNSVSEWENEQSFDTDYYPSGKVKSKGKYKKIGDNWQKHGKWEFFDEEGNLESVSEHFQPNQYFTT